MKNTREFVTLISATKEKDLRKAALRQRMTGAAEMTKAELVAAFIKERYDYRLAMLSDYLAARATRNLPVSTDQLELAL